MAIVRSVVATGRWIKGEERLIVSRNAVPQGTRPRTRRIGTDDNVYTAKLTD
jgi:hypothetical protein